MEKPIDDLSRAVWDALDPHRDFSESSRAVLDALGAYEVNGGIEMPAADDQKGLIALPAPDSLSSEEQDRKAA